MGIVLQPGQGDKGTYYAKQGECCLATFLAYCLPFFAFGLTSSESWVHSLGELPAAMLAALDVPTDLTICLPHPTPPPEP